MYSSIRKGGKQGKTNSILSYCFCIYLAAVQISSSEACCSSWQAWQAQVFVLQKCLTSSLHAKTAHTLGFTQLRAKRMCLYICILLLVSMDGVKVCRIMDERFFQVLFFSPKFSSKILFISDKMWQKLLNFIKWKNTEKQIKKKCRELYNMNTYFRIFYCFIKFSQMKGLKCLVWEILHELLIVF